MDQVTVLQNGAETYPAMIKAIEGARTSIHWANFCMVEGEAFKLFIKPLQDAAGRGVDVRIIVDAYGSKEKDEHQHQALTDAGANLIWFRPWTPRHNYRANNRMHKKLLVVDGLVGFTGGVGVGDIWLNGDGFPAPWRDTHFKITGPSVAAMEAAFALSWNKWSAEKLAPPRAVTGSGTIATNSPPTIYPIIAPVGHEIIRLINSAKQSIRITTAYFGPNRQLLGALARAAERGVDVHILINGPHTNHETALEAGRHQYERLLKRGVHLYEYQPTKIHSKLMTIDGEVSCIGSANMNFRSFYHDEEFNLTIKDVPLAKKLNAQFEVDIKDATEITYDEWSKRSLDTRVHQTAASLARFIF